MDGWMEQALIIFTILGFRIFHDAICLIKDSAVKWYINVNVNVVLLREVAVCVEALQTLGADDQLSAAQVANPTPLPDAHQLRVRGLSAGI